MGGLPFSVLMHIILMWRLSELPINVCIQLSVVPLVFLKIALWNVAFMLCFVGGLPHAVLINVVLM